MGVEECPRCKQFESDYKFRHCSYTVENDEDGKVIQIFECSRCNFKWEKKYK